MTLLGPEHIRVAAPVSHNQACTVMQPLKQACFSVPAYANQRVHHVMNAYGVHADFPRLKALNCDQAKC